MGKYPIHLPECACGGNPPQALVFYGHNLEEYEFAGRTHSGAFLYVPTFKSHPPYISETGDPVKTEGGR